MHDKGLITKKSTNWVDHHTGENLEDFASNKQTDRGASSINNTDYI